MNKTPLDHLITKQQDKVEKSLKKYKSDLFELKILKDLQRACKNDNKK